MSKDDGIDRDAEDVAVSGGEQRKPAERTDAPLYSGPCDLHPDETE